VKAPGFGEPPQGDARDIAILTAARSSRGSGPDLEKATLKDLGQAKRVEIDKEETTLIDGAGAPKQSRRGVKSIRTRSKKSPADYDKEKLQERVAKLQAAFAIVKVALRPKIEMRKEGRVEDALHATRAAVEEGIVAGGGGRPTSAPAALWTRSRATTPTRRPASRSCAAPWRSRCGRSSPTAAKSLGRANKVAEGKGNFGFNAQTEAYGDLVEMGVVDPTKVARTALQNAASVAGPAPSRPKRWLAELVEEKEGASPGGHGMGRNGRHARMDM